MQRTTDATLPVPGLVARWTALIPTVTPTVTSNGVTVNEQGVRDTVSQLELVPILQGNLADETRLAQNYQQEAERSDVLVGLQSTQIAGLNTQIVDQTKACTAQVSAVKADARKGKVKWFKIGYVAGLVSGWLGHAAGI
jgi:hypothetical protein